MDYLIPKWPVPAFIRACSTYRNLNLGFSHSPYQGLNLATHVGDNPNSVRKNRLLLQQALGLDELKREPFWLNQTHGTRALNLNSSLEQLVAQNTLGADFSYSVNSERQLYIPTVLTADCLPILMAGQRGDLIMAVHAGWKGLLAGILESALRVFLENGIDKSEILVWIGPGIGANAFEVGEEIVGQFRHLNLEYQNAFRLNNKKILGDLYQLVTLILQDNSIFKKNIYSDYLCTYSDKKRFFSYRRDGITGRMATLIWQV